MACRHRCAAKPYLPNWAALVVPLTSRSRRAWDLLMILVMIYLILSIPFHIGFLSGRFAAQSVQVSRRILDVQFGIDAVLLIDSGLAASLFEYETSGRRIRDPRRILRNYRRVRLVGDLVSTLPYDVLVLVASAAGVGEQGCLLVRSLLRLPKLVRLRMLRQHVSSLARAIPPQLHLTGGATRILITVLILLLVAHLSGSTWMLIASWLQPHDASASSWASVDIGCSPWAYVDLPTRYLRAVYFSMTVGEGCA